MSIYLGNFPMDFFLAFAHERPFHNETARIHKTFMRMPRLRPIIDTIGSTQWPWIVHYLVAEFLLTTEKYALKDSFKAAEHSFSQRKSQGHCKLRICSLFKSCLGLKFYLLDTILFEMRLKISKFRLSNYNLNRETWKINIEEGFRPVFSEKGEDEIRFYIFPTMYLSPSGYWLIWDFLR